MLAIRDIRDLMMEKSFSSKNVKAALGLDHYAHWLHHTKM